VQDSQECRGFYAVFASCQLRAVFPASSGEEGNGMGTTRACISLLAVVMATLTGGRAVAAAPRDIAPLVLHVTDYAHLKTGELLEAERLAAGVYARIGVQVIWAGGCATEAAADGAVHLDVILLSAEMTDRRKPTPAPMTFGQASRETRRAFIYS